MPMGAAPMAYVLWTRHLASIIRPTRLAQPRPLCAFRRPWLDAALQLAAPDGIRPAARELQQFRQWGSKTPGHPEHWLVPGIETTTGPLGQGFGNGVGMAIAQKYLAAHFNRPGHEIVDYKIYAIAGDGDLMEGVSSEAASLAGHLQLDNLIYFYDDNHISIEGYTTGLHRRPRQALRGLWLVRAEGRGRKRSGGHRRGDSRRPGGARTAVDHHGAHAHRLRQPQQTRHGGSARHGAGRGGSETDQAEPGLAAGAGVPGPGGSARPFPAGPRERARKPRPSGKPSWRLTARPFRTSPRSGTASSRANCPPGWKAKLPTFSPTDKPMATRQASGKVLECHLPGLPTLLGGSADLAPSTNTLIKGEKDFEPGSYGGRNFHFGVREHGMGAILNGMALERIDPLWRHVLRLLRLSAARCAWRP